MVLFIVDELSLGVTASLQNKSTLSLLYRPEPLYVDRLLTGHHWQVLTLTCTSTLPRNDGTRCATFTDPSRS
jgi:hypothetical protein